MTDLRLLGQAEALVVFLILRWFFPYAVSLVIPEQQHMAVMPLACMLGVEMKPDFMLKVNMWKWDASMNF